MTMIERVGEGLARRTNRRHAVRRAAAGVFGVVAAVAARGIAPSGTSANHLCARTTFGDCTCNPPNGRYCRTLSTSYCSGSACAGGCRYDPFIYPDACWCTAECRYGNGRTGYFRCCDCNCRGTRCACRAFVATA